MKFLIIGDNKALAHSIKSEFLEAGYKIRYAPNGELGLEIAQKVQFDLIVLDWTHPKGADLRVLAELGQTSLTPILMLVAEDSVRDIILSLNICGPYSCLTMPMNNEVLIGRIKALIPTIKWKQSVNNCSGNLNFDHVIWCQEVIESGDISTDPLKPLYHKEICKKKYRVGYLWECLVEEPIRCPNLISYGLKKFCLGKDLGSCS